MVLLPLAPFSSFPTILLGIRMARRLALQHVSTGINVTGVIPPTIKSILDGKKWDSPWCERKESKSKRGEKNKTQEKKKIIPLIYRHILI